jgi:signal transduction histidine kinase
MRAKTKILVAILGAIFVVVVVLSCFSIALLVRQRIQLSYANNNVISHEIVFDVRHSLETGLIGKQVDPNDPAQLRAMVAETLRGDQNLQATVMSVIRYSPAVYDIAVVDNQGRELVTTELIPLDQVVPRRPDFASLARASFVVQMRTVFGHPQVFDVSVPLNRNGEAFVNIRVGIRTSFLRAEMLPSLRNAVVLALMLAGASFLIAGLLANLALHPLVVINKRLDMLSQQASELSTTAEESSPGDEVALVSTKIERLGERMRSVQEVFSALKENLDQVLGNLQDGLVLFTRDGSAVLVSTAAANFLGLDRNAMLGKPITDILDRSTVLGRTIADAFIARIVLLQEEVLTEKGRHIQVSLDFIHDDRSAGNASLGALLTLHDAESAQQLQSDLELSRRMAAIGRLTAGVGHEVKNPINAIVVHVELLRNKLQNPSEEVRRHINVIQGEVQRLNRVVQTLVDFSRPLEVKLRDHDLRTIMDSVLELERVAMKNSGVSVDYTLPLELLPVHADSDLIKQALLNLMENARQAMAHGGTLTLDARRIGRDAVVTIRDTGVGIAQEQLDKIFNLYFTTKPSGSGIGLAMTYRIAQLHNGKISVESTEGVGTTFTLHLPLTVMETRPRPVLPGPTETDTKSLYAVKP